jgi:hypothetical protein
MKTDTENGVVILTPDQAKALLPDATLIHTMMNPSVGVFIGCDWKRDDLWHEIENCVCELSGPAATKAGHGLCVHLPAGYLFVETNRKEKENE